MPDDTTDTAPATGAPSPQGTTADIDTNAPAPTPAPTGEGSTAPPTDAGNEGATPAPADDFDLTADTEPDTAENAQEGTEKPEEEADAPYAVDIDDSVTITDDFRAILNEEGKASGIDSKTFGTAVSKVISRLIEAEDKAKDEKKAALQTDWGPDYGTRMKNVKAFASKLIRNGVLPADVVHSCQSPDGFRILDAWARSTAEDSFAGKGNASPWGTPAQEADAMLHNPAHPDYAALNDTTDRERFLRAQHKYERLIGYRR